MRTASVTFGLAVLCVACEGDGREALQEGPPGRVSFPVTEVLGESGASLGSVAFPTTCEDPAATTLRRGLALLHNMTYAEAERAFEVAAEQDPGCALAHWGRAMTYLHPLWPDVPSDAQLERGWRLLQEARAAGPGTPREEAYVEALEAYYRDAAGRPEPARLASYAQAWAEVARSYPRDPEAALFSALADIAVAPAAEDPLAALREAGAAAEAVLARIPDHPGAHHYIIHAYDRPALAERALSVARSYGEVAPDNAHALHMTSHIFTRVGLWEESIEFNQRSADAAAAHPIDGAVSHHHLHAVDYLAYAQLQRGQDEEAQTILEHLEALDGPVVDHAASAYAFAAVPARIALERRDWRRAISVRARWPESLDWERYPHLEAIPVFSRALGAARTGDLETAEASIARLAELQVRAAALPGAYDWGTQVEIQKLAAEAWVAYARSETDHAVERMTMAAELEAGSTKNPVTPGEVLPAAELLGDMLLELGRHAEARAAYERSLERSPNRLNGLAGAARAASAAGDEAAAAEYRRRLDAVTAES